MFSLATSVEQLPKKSYVNPKYTQVSPSRDATGSNFSNGQIQFKFEHSSDEWMDLSKSYIRMRIDLNDTSLVLVDADNVAPAMNMVACMFQSMELQLNGTTISRVSDFVPQIDTLLKRTECSGSHLKSIVNDCSIMDHAINTRFSIVESDAELIDQIAKSDVVGASAIVAVIDKARSLKEFELVWHPTCLSAFRQKQLLPGGSWNLILNPLPASTFKAHAIQSTGASKTLDTNYSLDVDNIYFYKHTVTGPRVQDTTYYLLLNEVRCQSTSISSTALTQYTFDVNPATSKLIIAYQDDRSTDTRTSRSIFTVYDGTPAVFSEEQQLTRAYLTYAGKRYPELDLEITGGGATANKEYLTSVYYDSIAVTGGLNCPGEVENLHDWKGRGMYLAFDTTKDSSDRSTRVNVNCQFDGSAVTTNMDMLLFSEHQSIVQVSVQSGQVRNVLVQDS